MNLSRVLFTTISIPSPGAGDENCCMLSDVTDGSRAVDLPKTLWSFKKEMLAKQEEDIRTTTKTIEKNNRLVNLLACKVY